MVSTSPEDLERQYDRLNNELSQLRDQQAQFVQQRTRELSKAHEAIDGSFQTTTIQMPNGEHPLARTSSPERENAIEEVLKSVQASDEYQRLSTEIAALETELEEVWSLTAEVIVDDDLTKMENIGKIWRSFGEDVSNHRVADAVDCHSQYPGRLVLDSDTKEVDYKDHVKKRKENQVSTEQRQSILARDDHACVRCGVSDDTLTIHHIDPVDNEGSATPRNLATLCENCHSQAHDARGAGAVVHNTNDAFWAWVQDGTRGFDPYQSDLADF